MTIELDRSGFEPGEPITGTLRWDGRFEVLDLQLGWRTVGKGDVDSQVVQSIVLHVSGQTQARFSLPGAASPYSFSGLLVSVVWEVRVNDDWATADVIIAPGGREVLLASS